MGPWMRLALMGAGSAAAAVPLSVGTMAGLKLLGKNLRERELLRRKRTKHIRDFEDRRLYGDLVTQRNVNIEHFLESMRKHNEEAERRAAEREALDNLKELFSKRLR